METSLSDKKSDIYLEFSIDRQSERKSLKIIVFIKRNLLLFGSDLKTSGRILIQMS